MLLCFEKINKNKTGFITFTYHLEFLEEIRSNEKHHHPHYHGISTTTNINNKTKKTNQGKQLEKT
jgi:hypothetical protein